jgi:hypothetical protein
MFFVLAQKDLLLIAAFSTLCVIIFMIIFISITKILPTKTGYLELEKRGVIITLGIHIAIIICCLVIIIYRYTSINYFLNNGINIIAYIQEVDKRPRKLHFTYVYEIDGIRIYG